MFTGIAGLLWQKTLIQKWLIYKENGQNQETFLQGTVCRVLKETKDKVPCEKTGGLVNLPYKMGIFS